MRFAPQTLGAPARAPMKRAATIALGLLLLSGPLAAEITPRAGPHDARVRDAIYVQGQVYNLVLMLRARHHSGTAARRGNRLGRGRRHTEL